jgi:hypothetical protein
MPRTTTSISVSLEIYKLIEENRLSFEESHDEILRRMLNLPIPEEQPIIQSDFYLGCSVSVPLGTQLRKFYKGMEYRADIKDGGIWLNGKKYPTLNQAANAVSDSNQNAWNFWEVKRPQDSKWMPLNNLRKASFNLSQEDLEDFY